MRGRQIAERVWDWLGAEKRLWELISAFLILYLLVLVIPQSPVPATAELPFTRWLVELRPPLKVWRPLLAALGLFTVRTALWMRGALAALGLVTLVRLTNLVERWTDGTRGQRWRHICIVAGSLLFIGGWGAYMLWGWSEPDLIAWPQSPLAMAERGIVLSEPVHPFLTRRYGLYLAPQGQAPGLEVRAFDAQESSPAPLTLSRTVRSTPEEVLRLTFSPQSPEAYFTIPTTDLIFRISQATDADDPRLQLQAYRSASGELVTEEQFNTDQDLKIDTVQVQIQYILLPRLTAIYNPGALFQLLGGGLFIGGSLWRGRKRAEVADVSPGDEVTPEAVGQEAEATQDVAAEILESIS